MCIRDRFITMQPALMILKAKGAELGITEPYQLFWVTGALYSFLDNTPTYLVFLTTAGSLGFTSGMATTPVSYTHLDVYKRQEDMRTQPLPDTREEFESRAVLYRILLELEQFLEIKKKFVEELTEDEIGKFWGTQEGD